MEDCLLFHFTFTQTGTVSAEFTVRNYGANHQTTEREFWNITPAYQIFLRQTTVFNIIRVYRIDVNPYPANVENRASS
jgi:hypothetical protein